MTQTGKCDTCRQRKVKCDQEKPKCSACRKRDRPCSYTYGKLSAFVIEDPTEFSGHGKAKVAPLIVPLISQDYSPKIVSGSGQRAEEEEEIVTQVPASRVMVQTSRASSLARKVQKAKAASRISDHIVSALSNNSLALARPCSSESALIARFIRMLGPQSQDENPWIIHGSWVISVPSRIGFSSVFDLAVEYSIDSFEYYVGKSVPLQRTAVATRGKALKALRLALQNSRRPTLDIIFAIQMHFHAEIFMGKDNWINYSLHSVGLSNLLKNGSMELLDDENYWSAIDASYMDEIGEAAFGGRPSKYDTPFYITITSRESLLLKSPNASPYRRASLAVMHSLIQIPRLIYFVRMARSNPESIDSLAAAVSLAEYLWIMNPSDIMDDYIQQNTSQFAIPPGKEISDIISDSLHARSISSAILMTRYWTLQAYLSGLTLSLYEHFPIECSESLLPEVVTIYQVDLYSAVSMARFIPYTLSIFPKIPVVPLRLLSVIQFSIGPWIRKDIRLNRSLAALDPTSPEHAELTNEIALCKRMKQWTLDQSNNIQESWGVDMVDVEIFEIALDIISGGPIPGWLPTWMEDLQTGKMDMHWVEKMILDEVNRKKGLGGDGWWVKLDNFESRKPLSQSSWTIPINDLHSLPASEIQ